MPERTPAFDFKGLKPNVPVEFTLLKESFSGRKDGADYDWHAYPCSYAGNEVMVFTPSERVHGALQYLKILPKTKFTITKGSDINLTTGKSFIFYTITYGDQTVDTKDTLPAEPTGEAEPEAPTDWNDVPPIKEPGTQGKLTLAQFMAANVANNVKIFKVHCGEAWEQSDMVEKAQYLLDIMRISGPLSCTQLINQEKNGGR